MEKVLQRKIRFGYAIIKLQPLYRQKETDTNTTAKVWQEKNTRTHKNKYSRFSKAENIKKKRIYRE